MDIKVLEKKAGRLRVEVAGERHTFLNLLRENAWKAGADQASYMIEHPYLSNPKITVKAKDPKKVLKDSAQMAINESQEFEREFKRAVKK